MLNHSLFRKYKGRIIFSISASIVAGISSALLLAFVNSAVQEIGTGAERLLWVFIGLCAMVFISGILSEVVLTRLGQELALDLRMRLCRSILDSPFAELQKLGRHMLLAALTEDIETVTGACQVIPSLSIALATVTGCFVYLGWLSWELLVMVLLVILVGITVFLIIQYKALYSLESARMGLDKLFKHIRGLTEGTKELKLHKHRRDVFLDKHIRGAGEKICRDYCRGMNTYTIGINTGSLVFYLAIGFVLFVFPSETTMSTEVITGYTLGLLFVMTPLVSIMQAFPSLGEGLVALRKIHALGLSLADEQGVESKRVDLTRSAQNVVRTLELVGVTHRYDVVNEERNFQVGPIDLKVNAGEIVFMIGGNGSGKTTLAFLIAGLYKPNAGHILLNGERITDASRDDYRQQFAAVFAEPYLFDSLMGYENSDVDSKARELLVQFRLDHKVSIENNCFSTVDLSRGQCKRLALLVAYLDDRPFYVFDEWAADQDSEFKDLFYKKLLPDLKKRGKTVIVVTHDDRYFHIADRCIKLVDGRLSDRKHDTDDSKNFLVERGAV